MKKSEDTYAKQHKAQRMGNYLNATEQLNLDFCNYNHMFVQKVASPQGYGNNRYHRNRHNPSTSYRQRG